MGVEYRVRGYSSHHGQWIHGDGVMFSEFAEDYAKEVGYDGDTILYTDHGTYRVDNESCGRSSELYDKDNVEIYEGDLVEYEYMHGQTIQCSVKFDKGMFMLADIPQGYGFRQGWSPLWEWVEAGRIKVVGTLHKGLDNTEAE